MRELAATVTQLREADTDGPRDPATLAQCTGLGVAQLEMLCSLYLESAQVWGGALERAVRWEAGLP